MLRLTDGVIGRRITLASCPVLIRPFLIVWGKDGNCLRLPNPLWGTLETSAVRQPIELMF